MRAADSRIEFGTNRSRLASGDRLGCADPLVGSLYGFLTIAYLIFYYGTTLLRANGSRSMRTVKCLCGSVVQMWHRRPPHEMSNLHCQDRCLALRQNADSSR